jgi:hypothetical protein
MNVFGLLPAKMADTIMPRHPVDGIAGSKPRVPAEKGNGKVSKAELTQLNREYLVARNAQMAAKAAMSQMEANRARGELISLRLARLQLSYLLTIFRQRTLAVPAVWSPRCVGLPDTHAAAQVLRAAALSLLEELQELPARVTDPDWLQHVADNDEQAEGTPERRQTPVQAKTAAAKAKARREKKNTAQRRRRAEGRA